MARIRVAICDTDDRYRERLVAYLMEHQAQEMQIQAFSVPELFTEYTKNERPDVALFGTGFEYALQEAVKRGICSLKLCESPLEAAEEGEGKSTEKDCCVQVFRYQSAERIVHEIKAAGGSFASEAPFAGSRHIQIIGVCSPIGHEMQTPFSVVYGAQLAKRYKTLYVNLTKRPGIADVLGMKGDYELGDIVLPLKSHRLERKTFLKSVYEIGEMQYIPPFANPENIHDFLPEDYRSLLKFIEEETDFEAVIFDFGEGVSGLGEMLASCTAVCCLMKSGVYYEAQLACFLEYLRRETGEEPDRLHILNLPFSAKYIRGDTDVLRQLEWSEFGDYVRNDMTGGGM